MLDFGVLVLATQLRGVRDDVESLRARAFFGGVENMSAFSSSSSNIKLFFWLFVFLTGTISSGFLSSSLLAIAADKSFSASFLTRLSSFFLVNSNPAMIGVRSISVIGDLKIVGVFRKIFENFGFLTLDLQGD